MPFGESTDRNFVGMVQMKLNSERAVFVVKSTKASSNKEILLDNLEVGLLLKIGDIS